MINYGDLIAVASIGTASLIFLAYYDLAHRRLPNSIVAAYAATMLLHAWLSGHTWQQLGWHFAIALLAFGITFVFFALGWLGGGDVKLWSAVMLWAGPDLALPALVIGTVSGGILGIICWLAQKLWPKLQHTWLRRPLWALSAERGVPYGVALSIAGLFVLYASR